MLCLQFALRDFLCRTASAGERKQINNNAISIFHSQLDVQLQDEAGGDISSFITNGEWDLLGNHLALPALTIKFSNCI